MKKLLVAILFFAGVISVVSAEAVPIMEEPLVACTMEVKICPDGSAVGRSGPNCEFTPCPGEEIVGNDRDEHGCIGSAGYTWSEEKGECIRPWEEKKPEEKTLCPTFEVPDSCLENEILITIDTGECAISKCVDKRTHILENCKQWSDGCNTCTRVGEDMDTTTCTKKLCSVEEMEEIACLEYFVTEEIGDSLLFRIREATSEEERIGILKEEKESLIGVETKENLIAEKSNEIFTKFDVIISKLKEVIQIIKSNSLLLEGAGIQVGGINTLLLSIDEKLQLVEDEKAEAWILMQKTIELEDKEEARENLESVKILLKTLKDDIKLISVDIKGVIQNLKTVWDK